MDALQNSRSFESIDQLQLPVRNLAAEAGNEYVCFARMPGEGCAPADKACVTTAKWAAKH